MRNVTNDHWYNGYYIFRMASYSLDEEKNGYVARDQLLYAL